MSKNFLNKVQKIICFAFVIASCLVLIGSLCFFDPDWDVFQVSGNKNIENFFTTFLGGQSIAFTNQSTAKEFYISLYKNIQAANNALFYTAFVSLVLIAIAGITGIFTRKKYYISNLVTGIAAGLVSIIMSVITIAKSIALKGDFSKITPDLERFKELWGDSYYRVITSSNCIIGIVLPIILIVVACVFCTFIITKYIVSNKKDMIEEA